jgi:hypothetical protein
MKHLSGVHFPAGKQDILDQARQSSAPDSGQVLDVLRQIDDREYDSPAEILKQVGKIE